MTTSKIKTSQRRAYGRICATVFMFMQTIANFTLDWSINFPEALTDGEKEYISKLKLRIDKDANLVRAFSWRMKETP